MKRAIRISVLDMLIMVAAMAPGLAVSRLIPEYVQIEHALIVDQTIVKTPTGRTTKSYTLILSASKSMTPAGISFQRRPSYWLVHVPCWVSPCLASVSVGALVLGLKKPRPRLHRLGCRPGILAGFAVLMAMAVEGVACVRYLTTSGYYPGKWSNGWSHYSLAIVPPLIRLTGCLVAACWITLALTGRWLPERNSGGRIGRLLGWCWVAMAVSSEVGLWCFALNY